MPSPPPYENIDINDELKALGVTKFRKIEAMFQIYFGEDCLLTVDINKESLKTLNNLETVAIDANLGKERIAKLKTIIADKYPTLLTFKETKQESDAKSNEKQKEQSSAVKAVNLAREFCEDLFLDNLGQPYAAIKVGNHIEVIPIKSEKYKNWLTNLYFDVTLKEAQNKKKSENKQDSDTSGDILSSEALLRVLRVIKAKAEFSGLPRRELFLRVAKKGLEIAAKTAKQEMVKMIVDPSEILTLSISYDIESMAQKIAHNYVCFFDNISKISDVIQDLLCRAITGTGFMKREIFTVDEVIYKVKHALGLTGVNLAATKPDLVDRGLIIEHKPIANKKRLLVIWEKFEALRPKLLGYIFDILVKVLQFASSTETSKTEVKIDKPIGKSEKAVDTVDEFSQSTKQAPNFHKKVAQELGTYVAWDLEWGANYVIKAASFVDSTGKSEVKFRDEDFNGSERDLLNYIMDKICNYKWSMGWHTQGNSEISGSDVIPDLKVIYNRCHANGIDSIVKLGHKGVPYTAKGYKHIDLYNVYSQEMVKGGMYQALLGYGKYHGILAYSQLKSAYNTR
jgi:hypothetical protein